MSLLKSLGYLSVQNVASVAAMTAGAAHTPTHTHFGHMKI